MLHRKEHSKQKECAHCAKQSKETRLIWSNIGKRATIWLVIITVPQVLFLGFLFNSFL